MTSRQTTPVDHSSSSTSGTGRNLYPRNSHSSYSSHRRNSPSNYQKDQLINTDNQNLLSSKQLQQPQQQQQQNIQTNSKGKEERKRSPYMRQNHSPEGEEKSKDPLPVQHKILRLSKKFDIADFARKQRWSKIGKSFIIAPQSLASNRLIPILPVYFQNATGQ